MSKSLMPKPSCALVCFANFCNKTHLQKNVITKMSRLGRRGTDHHHHCVLGLRVQSCSDSSPAVWSRFIPSLEPCEVQRASFTTPPSEDDFLSSGLQISEQSVRLNGETSAFTLVFGAAASIQVLICEPPANCVFTSGML